MNNYNHSDLHTFSKKLEEIQQKITKVDIEIKILKQLLDELEKSLPTQHKAISPTYILPNIYSSYFTTLTIGDSVDNYPNSW